MRCIPVLPVCARKLRIATNRAESKIRCSVGPLGRQLVPADGALSGHGRLSQLLGRCGAPTAGFVRCSSTWTQDAAPGIGCMYSSHVMRLELAHQSSRASSSPERRRPPRLPRTERLTARSQEAIVQ